jgi:hypothetical protein
MAIRALAVFQAGIWKTPGDVLVEEGRNEMVSLRRGRYDDATTYAVLLALGRVENCFRRASRFSAPIMLKLKFSRTTVRRSRVT